MSIQWSVQQYNGKTCNTVEAENLIAMQDTKFDTEFDTEFDTKFNTKLVFYK